MRLLRCVCFHSGEFIEIDTRYIVALKSGGSDRVTTVYTTAVTFHVEGSLERIKEQMRPKASTPKRWWQL